MTDLRKVLFLFCLFFSFLMVAQNKVTAKELKTKISNNTKLYKANIDEAYKELNNLLKESVILKDSISEMKLLDRKCRYFYSKNMMDSLIITSENLQKNLINIKTSILRRCLIFILQKLTLSINFLIKRLPILTLLTRFYKKEMQTAK